jgi:two-component system KDP operon response regulator KdpE
MKKGKPEVLVVDDEPRYVWAIRINLEARGYSVLTADTGLGAIKMAASRSPDLILLDIRLPDLDGFEACRRIRQFSSVPVIMLTALAQEADKVKGLDAGADDYLTKPFGVEELLARVRAGLRRASYAGGQPTDPVFVSGTLRVDMAQQRVSVGDREVHLTATEYRLLCELVRHAGKILVPAHLLERVWGMGYESEFSLLRQAIHRLRRKIEPDPDHPQFIHTRHNLGYLFSPPE